MFNVQDESDESEPPIEEFNNDMARCALSHQPPTTTITSVVTHAAAYATPVDEDEDSDDLQLLASNAPSGDIHEVNDMI